MSGCMREDKPLISIVMAVYHPRMDWLIEQLDSLNAQTYPNLELIACDDGPDEPVDESVFAGHITAFPWELVRNGENLGSNKTFERLTAMARGEYIAYCDQDDIWLPQKLSTLEDALEKKNALLVCSDVEIIDDNGRKTADSMTQIRRSHTFRAGSGLAKGLLFSNFVTGCTMLIHRSEAVSAIPFCPYMIHDHYLALWCAERGEIAVVRTPLIQYRIHSGNQTGIMAGVHDKKSYGSIRIKEAMQKFYWLDQHFPCSLNLKESIKKGVIWMEARNKNWEHRGGSKIIWKYREFSPLTSIFEIVAPKLPETVFLWAICFKKKNIL